MTKFAITGATGQLGRMVVERLRGKVPAADLVGLVRNVEKASDLGVSVRAADYSRPDTLSQAFAGVDTVLLISSSEVYGSTSPQDGLSLHYRAAEEELRRAQGGPA